LSLHWLCDAICWIQPANLLFVAPEEHAPWCSASVFCSLPGVVLV
jgi:hypothetical protein